ncbi:MFS transporter [Allopusillimonas ginsengisoli]|uniref:MFS transporter n=1 Tax=Allopusillimonas ginsengisoli TaxID=453575 RepID=UPI002468E3CC|nr:MFS transporter [Allopusillimonas ginsengisoli]
MVTAVFTVAQKWGVAMLGPFMVDYGLDLQTIGILTGVGSMFVGSVGALIVGAVVRLTGAKFVLILALILQAGLFAGLLVLSVLAERFHSVILLLGILSSSGVMAFGYVALYSSFMRWSDIKQAGVDFTLFQCADGLFSMLGGVVAGFIAQHLGYTPFYVITLLISISAIGTIAAMVTTLQINRFKIAFSNSRIQGRLLSAASRPTRSASGQNGDLEHRM